MPKNLGGSLPLRRLRGQPTHVREHDLDLIVGQALDQVNQLVAVRGHISE